LLGSSPCWWERCCWWPVGCAAGSSRRFSTPIRLGYLGSVAVVVFVGQLPTLLGFSVHADGLIESIHDVQAGIAEGRVVPAAAAVGLRALG
jgi:MFS superfamily sulfate permease-like transporter